MLARLQFRSLNRIFLVRLFFFVSSAFLLGAFAQAQIAGVPPSVTSIGFGGNNNAGGVRPSVTSMGPITQPYNWYAFGNCCANFFLPPNVNSGAGSGHRHRGGRDRDRDKDRDNRRHSDLAGGDVVYVPFAVPYAAELDDDSSEEDSAADSDSSSENGDTSFAGHAAGVIQRGPVRDYVVKTADASVVREPVVPQPQRSTVLIFKDGRQSEVVNYAIVGATLFDFSAGRTHKIPLSDIDLEATHKVNDDRGVDFQIPAAPVE